MSKFFISFISLLILSCSNIENLNENPDSNVSVPANYSQVGEMIIRGNYWVEAYQDSVENNFLVFLVSNRNYTDKLILDSVLIKTNETTEWIDYGTVMHNGITDSEIVVKINSNNDSINDIVQAWRTNLKEKKFEEISTEGLSIENY